jgi:hypothetical protein
MNSVGTLPLVITDNSARSVQFRTRTIITERNGRKVVQKQALTEEAQPFLRLVVERERKNAEYLKGRFDTLCGSLTGDVIEYEYLPYQSLLNNIGGHLANRRWADANRLFWDYVYRLNSLPKMQSVPEEFLRTIAGDGGQNTPELQCLSRGLLDLVPRNILVDGDRWIVMDHEWSFDFPAPMLFLLFRAVRELATSLQREIRICTGSSNPAVGIFARNLETYYVPKDWAKYITTGETSLGRLLCWEMGFQWYVEGRHRDTVGRVRKHPQMRLRFSPQAINGERMAKNLAGVVKGIPGMRALVHLLERQAAQRAR